MAHGKTPAHDDIGTSKAALCEVPIGAGMPLNTAPGTTPFSICASGCDWIAAQSAGPCIPLLLQGPALFPISRAGDRMSRTAAKFTLADLNRAAKAAKGVGYCVRMAPGGDIVLEPPGEAQKAIPVDVVRKVRL